MRYCSVLSSARKRGSSRLSFAFVGFANRSLINHFIGHARRKEHGYQRITARKEILSYVNGALGRRSESVFPSATNRKRLSDAIAGKTSHVSIVYLHNTAEPPLSESRHPLNVSPNSIHSARSVLSICARDISPWNISFPIEIPAYFAGNVRAWAKW